ncbi:hypothetical protein [Shewanella sp.]|uniref:hypothetical protein n=1 Tax=Shewanella sp. TaxID=50422 RepID=UPI003A981733
MPTPIIEDIHKFLPRATDGHHSNLEHLLEVIDCPDDFRGLQKVISTLEYMFSVQPKKFSSLIGLNEQVAGELLECFTEVSDDYAKQYTNQSHGKGWMSKRPIYSLLFIFFDYLNLEAAIALMTFLEHYITNEQKVAGAGREESSVRAFRLLYTDKNVSRHCFESRSAPEMCQCLKIYREKIKLQYDENFAPSTLLAYLLELEHFYRLDWKNREPRQRVSNHKVRASYSRKKIERVIGSENLYTASLNSTRIDRYFEGEGVTATEDYPELSIVKTEQPTTLKPNYEEPDISVIKDIAKIREVNWNIANDVRRSHNITRMGRNVLQPHELSYLWMELQSDKQGKIQQIPHSNIKLILLFVMLTGRTLESACRLPIAFTSQDDFTGLMVTDVGLKLIVAPRPTSTKGRHSINKNLLNTKISATLHLPKFFHSMVMRTDINGCGNLSGGYSVTNYRKAIESFLKNINQKFDTQISLKRMEFFLPNIVMADETVDPVLLEIVTDKLSYYSRSPRHYAWYTEAEINQKLQKLWFSIFERIQFFDGAFEIPELEVLKTVDDRCGIGSQFTPTRTSIIDWVTRYQVSLKSYVAFDVVRDLEHLIDYHNKYTIYTAILFLNGSGYRAVNNPLPSFDLLLSRYDGLCISDKDSRLTFAHTRIVACPSILKEQLAYYMEHLKTLANLLNHLLPKESAHLYLQCCDHQLINLQGKIEKTDWFLSVKNSKSNDGLFLLFVKNDADDKDCEDDTYRSTNLGPKLLSQFIELPTNFGRHFVRRYLQTKNVHQELIKFQLGHWVAGETPLEKHSSLSHEAAIQQLKPILDDMLSELGWSAIPSLITRKRA